MARISGVDIPREKRLEISLTYIFGIGKPTAQRICSDTGLDSNERVRNLTEDEINKIRAWVEQNIVVDEDGKPFLIDFERVGMGNVDHDLANTIDSRDDRCDPDGDNSHGGPDPISSLLSFHDPAKMAKLERSKWLA